MAIMPKLNAGKSNAGNARSKGFVITPNEQENTDGNGDQRHAGEGGNTLFYGDNDYLCVGWGDDFADGGAGDNTGWGKTWSVNDFDKDAEPQR